MLQRLLIEKMEHRIIVGILSFLGIMVLVGWIAINENGRMQAFQAQYHARSIERGAALFNTNCASCHGNDGRGLLGIAPALNSPYLFGHSFLADIDRRIDALTRERNAAGTTDERKAEIDALIADLNSERNSRIAQMQPAINAGYDPERPSRLANLGWSGTLHSYIYTTLVHGRPVSGLYWPQGMAAWSQTAGGPLRGDQLEDLTNYILNWDKGDRWTIDDLNAVIQHPINPVNPATVVMASVEAVGTNVAEIEAELVNYTGDPVNGQALYNGAAFACMGCHMNAAVAPLTQNTYPNLLNGTRLSDPALAGYTPDRYLIESIVAPNAYIVPGYPAGVMPQNFGDRLSYQDLADILAYIKSYDDPGAQASAAAG